MSGVVCRVVGTLHVGAGASTSAALGSDYTAPTQSGEFCHLRMKSKHLCCRFGNAGFVKMPTKA